MTAIMDDFSQILPYLDGRSFNENMSITYSTGANVGFRNDVLVNLCRNKRVLRIGCWTMWELWPLEFSAHGRIGNCRAEQPLKRRACCAPPSTTGVHVDENAVCRTFGSRGDCHPRLDISR
jgi:hypothetical protein